MTYVAVLVLQQCAQAGKQITILRPSNAAVSILLTYCLHSLTHLQSGVVHCRCSCNVRQQVQRFNNYSVPWLTCNLLGAIRQGTQDRGHTRAVQTIAAHIPEKKCYKSKRN